MTCHEHAINDIDLQITMNELETDLLTDSQRGEVPAYNTTKVDDLEQRKLKLYYSKRFHQTAMNAYWYYLAKAGK